MEKEINQDMVNRYATKTTETTNEQQQNNIDWVNTRDYKKMIKFRVFPANSKENKKIGGAFSSGAHWLEYNGEKVRYQCPEKTFPESGIECPVCKMQRELKAMGYTEEDMSKDGRFGPENIFRPRLSSTVKCVVIDTDLKHDWDRSHISLLQQNGTALITWLVDEYINPEKPNFTDWTKGSIIKFSRDTDNGKWNREVLPDSVAFNLWNAPTDVVEKVQKENEDITTAELFRMPSDEQTIKVKQILESIKADIIAKKNAAPTQTTAEAIQQQTSTWNKPQVDSYASAVAAAPVTPQAAMYQPQVTETVVTDEIPF